MARVWLIAGPTASGKSALGLSLAAEIDGEIVNADALQVYRDFRCLTARPSLAETEICPHHLYGVADAAQAWSVGAWLRAVQPILGEIEGRGRPAILVGGTGLYFNALTQGLAEIPAIPTYMREAVRTRLETLGETAFRAALADRDPAAAGRIAPGDRQRLARAMEVLEATGRTLTDWQSDSAPLLAPDDYRALILDPPRDALYARCDARLGEMIEHGAVEEVAAVLARKLDTALPALKAVGYRELAHYLNGELSLDNALTLARQETRRYAKRQTTWFRNRTPDWPRVKSLDAEAQWAALSSG
jgi:tRNA dimethylallyltransferase